MPVMFFVGWPPSLEIIGPRPWPHVGQWWIALEDDHDRETHAMSWEQLRALVDRIAAQCEALPDVLVWTDERGQPQRRDHVRVRWHGDELAERARSCAELMAAIERALDARVETRIRQQIEGRQDGAEDGGE